MPEHGVEHWKDADECQRCGAPRCRVGQSGGVPLRAIRMRFGGRELLCQGCFVDALEDGEVDPADPRVDGGKPNLGVPSAPGQTAPNRDLRSDGGTDADGVERKKAEEFWSQYEIPFEHDTCIKVRRSGLMRGSSGTGHASDTVVHLHVKEAFKDGRLSRDEDSYLCENDSFVGFQGREERHAEDGESYVPAVTCDTCLQRMERWEIDTESTDADGSDRFADSTDLRYGVVEERIGEDDILLSAGAGIVVHDHDSHYALSMSNVAGMGTRIHFDELEYDPDGGTIWFRKNDEYGAVTTGTLDYYVLDAGHYYGLVGEWFLEQLDLEEWRTDAECPECGAAVLSFTEHSGCESPDCDFFTEGIVADDRSDAPEDTGGDETDAA